MGEPDPGIRATGATPARSRPGKPFAAAGEGTSAPALALVASTALLQAGATVCAFAWLARELPVSELGRFGLHLALVSFVLGLDGIRQATVFASASPDPNGDARVRMLAGLSTSYGIVVGTCVAFACRVVFDIEWREALPLALFPLMHFAVAPGLGKLEGRRGPQYAQALHSIGWSLAIGTATLVSTMAGAVAPAAWCLLLSPAITAGTLASGGMLVRPTLLTDRATRRMATDSLKAHLVTAISGFVDKGFVAGRAGQSALGAYVPLAELAGRACALAGLVAGVFLRAETIAAASGQRRAGHHAGLMNAYFIAAGAAIAVAAILSPALLDLFVAQRDPQAVLAFRLLLAGVILNVGAQWAAVTLRARGSFDVHGPYLASLLAASALAPWMVPAHGIVGASLVALTLRAADVALLLRARRNLSRVQLASLASGFVAVLATIAA